jgi:centractin
MEEKQEILKLPIVLDIGSGEIKAGFSGEEKPKIIFKNIIGEPKYKKVLHAFNKENQEINVQYIGEDCDKNMGVIKLKNPVRHGIFSNEQDILSIFNYIYSKLGLNSEEIQQHPLLVTEPLLNPYTNREKIASTLFESLGAPAVFFASQPILSLFSTSSTSGTVLESGEGVTQSCVVYEGFSLPNSYERFDYGGADVSEYLKLLLKKKGYNFYNSTEFRLVNEIKENSCFCLSNNLNIDINDAKKGLNRNPINYYLPDGTSISIGEERLLAPEILFNTEYMGKEYLSLSDIIMSSINKVEIQLRQKLYENILLSGGNTAFRGLKDKLTDEIKNKAYKNLKINLKSTPKPEYCCWLGGNIISTLEIFKKMCVNKNEWNEKGTKIVHIKTI